MADNYYRAWNALQGLLRVLREDGNFCTNLERSRLLDAAIVLHQIEATNAAKDKQAAISHARDQFMQMFGVEDDTETLSDDGEQA